MERLSVDTSRSSIDNKRNTKRNALREFYKLQPAADPDASLIASSVISSARTSFSDLTSVAGEEDYEAEERRLEAKFEAGSFDAEEIAREILSSRGSGSRVLKDLLKKENWLLQSIRVLQSEQKALVYNNYSRLIAVSETLAKMKDGSHDKKTDEISIVVGDKVETAQPIEKTREKLPGLIQDISTASRDLKMDGVGGKVGAKQVAQWLMNTPKEAEKLEGQERDQRIDESLKVLDLWMQKSKVGGLSELKQKIEGLRSD
ncbi:hypothetical protein CJU90_5308 [Yarrowia sp. C11]|nr:hypothetical protein CJU90_5308 [Yarrowia sp. C11]KAG5363911.1 hypothetical protein CKK34_2686 [Yarrowia sp. E02]